VLGGFSTLNGPPQCWRNSASTLKQNFKTPDRQGRSRSPQHAQKPREADIPCLLPGAGPWRRININSDDQNPASHEQNSIYSHSFDFSGFSHSSCFFRSFSVASVGTRRPGWCTAHSHLALLSTSSPLASQGNVVLGCSTSEFGVVAISWRRKRTPPLIKIKSATFIQTFFF